MESNGYTAKIEIDEYDGVLLGVIENIRDVVTFEATTVPELEKEFHASVNEYIAYCREHGQEPEKPCSEKPPRPSANAAAISGIRRGLQGMYDGTGEDAEDAFASLERELGIAEQAQQPEDLIAQELASKSVYVHT